MLDRVDLGGVHNGFLVGAGHADVEGGDGGLACQVFPGYIDTGLEQDVVYGKACDFFHGKSPFLVCNYSEPARFRFAVASRHMDFRTKVFGHASMTHTFDRKSICL